MSQQLLIQKAVQICGFTGIGRACGVSYQAVRKWSVNGLPRTEWTNETDHSTAIEKATEGEVTRAELLAAPRANNKKAG